MAENNNTMRYSLSWMDMYEYDVVLVATDNAAAAVAVNGDDQLYAKI